MNPLARKKLDRLLHDLDRSHRRTPRRWSTSPLIFALGLILADVVLVRLVPTLWESLLPGGLDAADNFVGWPRLVWTLALLCVHRPFLVRVGIGCAAVGGFVVSSWGRPGRIAVWLAAVGVIVLNAALLVVTLHSALQATAASAGLNLG